MPTIAGKGLSSFAAGEELKAIKSGQIPPTGESTPCKRRLRSNSVADDSPITSTPSPNSRKSPRTSIRASPNFSPKEIGKESGDKLGKLLAKKLSDCFVDKPKWNPRDMEQLSAVKEALHVSCVPSMIVCREDEQKRILEFCKQCVENQKAGSLYASGCPGTGKSLSMERVKESLLDWAQKEGFQPPAVLSVNCTSLTNTNEIFMKIIGKGQQRKKINCPTSALQHLRRLYSENQQSTSTEMKLIIVDELDYLITKDRAVLHDLFMLTTLPFSKCILIGIANAIDLAERFLPKLQSLNCKPVVVNFRAYSKDQITKIFQQRLMVLPYTVFQPQALELCARKVAAASGDMRKALCICRSAIEMLEEELREYACNMELLSTKTEEEQTAAIGLTNKEIDIVRVDHMALAFSKAYGSPVVATIQSLPQHQQIILCAAVKLFRSKKKDATISELSKHYTEICKSILIPPVGNMELSSMCRVLDDQGLIKLGQSREDKLRRISLKVDEADVSFALQGVRVFRNCLLQC